jgi:hypothetical protein
MPEIVVEGSSSTWRASCVLMLLGLGLCVGCTTQATDDDGAAGASALAGHAGNSAGMSAGVQAAGNVAVAGNGGTSGEAIAGSGGAAGSAGTMASGAGQGGGSGTTSSAGEDSMGDSGMPIADSGTPDDGEVPPAGTLPIDAPVADDCITDVSAGDHDFDCDGINYLVMVDERCTQNACGLIMDVHGASMSGQVMRTNNRLHQLAPPEGYLTVHPTAPTGAWDFVGEMPKLADFMDRMIKAFHVETRRVHVTGFSMGSGATFWFLCNRTTMLASTGPVTGSSASQVVVEATGDSCIESIDAQWMPRVPILFMSGSEDSALSIADARARADGIASRLSLTGGDVIDSGNGYSRKRWQDGEGMILDFLEHDYTSGILAGHCIPGGPASDVIFACGQGDLDWGQTVLDWFIAHPKR